MKIALALSAPALLLAGTALAQDAPYRAHGNAPGWSLRIGGGYMALDRAGHRTRRARTPEARPSFNGMRYVTQRMTVDVTYAPCIDAAGRSYHDRVTVMTRGGILHGCGGAIIAPPAPPPFGPPPMGHGPGVAALDGSAWSIASVDGIPAATARPASIHFSNGRVEGNAGCNAFGGAYQQRGVMLSTTQIISTQMACPGPGMNIEGKVFRILEGPARLSYRGGDTLTVSVPGSSMTLAREHWAR